MQKRKITFMGLAAAWALTAAISGCNAEMIECFMKKFRAHNRTDSLKLLEMQRKKLLDNLHREQKCIDCLDYLVHDIEKSEHI